MTQQEAIDSIYQTLEANEPERYAKLISMPLNELVGMAGEYSQQNPTVFKPTPPGSLNFACFLTAIYFYAQALALCDLITDPTLRKSCRISAKEAYCDAHDACVAA